MSDDSPTHPPADLPAALAELTGMLLSTPSLQQLLDEMARAAASVTSPRAACGVTLRNDDRTWTVASSDSLASNVDEVQYGTDQGPCLQTLRTGQVVDVRDLAAETRWGGYRAHALGYGVRSSLSLPLAVDGEPRGALNLYGRTVDAFDEVARRAAAVVASHLSALLTLASRQARQTDLSGQLREALASRSVIDQAIGIVMEQQRTSPRVAFAVLRQLSQRQNRKLRDVAAEIVTVVAGEPPAETPFDARVSGGSRPGSREA
jgi:GAF domain-containing protein